MIIFRVGSADRPATEEDIEIFRSQVQQAIGGGMNPRNAVIVTHHDVDYMVVPQDALPLDGSAHVVGISYAASSVGSPVFGPILAAVEEASAATEASVQNPEASIQNPESRDRWDLA